MTPRPGRPNLRAEEPFDQVSSSALWPTNSWNIKDFSPPTTPWPPRESDPLRRWSYLRCCFRVHP